MRLMMLEILLEQILGWLLAGLVLILLLRVIMQLSGVDTELLDALIDWLCGYLWRPAFSLIGLYLVLLSRSLVLEWFVA